LIFGTEPEQPAAAPVLPSKEKIPLAVKKIEKFEPVVRGIVEF
jgi:hypothetical protein